jgi:hypothetical protein
MIFVPGKSKVFVITSTPKKRGLDPIDFSTGSYQDEGNSGFINPIDSSSDYLPGQLRFFPQSTQIKTKTKQYIRFTSYQDNCGFAKTRAHARLILHHIWITLKF